MKTCIVTILSCLGCYCTSTPIQAAGILTYQIATLAPTTVDPNATASNVNFTGSAASQFALSNELAINAATGATNAATAVSTASYFQFSITPNTGYEIDFTQLSFQVGSGGSPTGYVIRSSIDAYATDLQTGSMNTSYPTMTTFTVDLSGASFQNLNTQANLRIYTYTTGSNPAAVYDNVILQGSVVTVPEPGTFGLASVAIPLGVYASRRRRVR